MWLCESVVTLKVVGKKEGDYYRSLHQKKRLSPSKFGIYFFIYYIIIVFCLFLFLISNMGSRKSELYDQ